jgi:uncharacterized protein
VLLPVAMTLFAPMLALIALAYSAVGLGGGTAYLALLSFWDATPDGLRPIAWSLNCIVTIIGLANYARAGHLDVRLAWPFLLGGIVGAAAGAAIPVDAATFQVILAVVLAATALRAATVKSGPKAGAEDATQRPWLPSLLVGTVIGVISGLVGMGGGIVLGPVILALRWADAKRTAAITSAYILLSSASALGTHLASGGGVYWSQVAIFGAACAAGGFVGSLLGARFLSPRTLQTLLAVLATAAALKLGMGALP